jgi:hypothetical protein
MCDYSLHVYPNRLAVDGEELVVHRFGGASLGLASPADIQTVMARTECDTLWCKIKQWFKAQWELQPGVPAVCVPPGARLMLADIPKGLRREFGVGEIEDVRFVQTGAEANTYRDAVRFKNGQEILLQALHEGQRVLVLSLETEETLVAARRWPEVQVY